MEPVYFEGDRVLTFNWGRVKKGDVIVFIFRHDFLVKRVVKITNKKISVKGDNVMSMKFEPIDFRQVMGRVLLKY